MMVNRETDVMSAKKGHSVLSAEAALNAVNVTTTLRRTMTMSSKRTTKASAILQVASQRVDETEAIRDDLRTQLMIAQAIYEAAVTTFKSLEAVLGSEPAKPKAPRKPRTNKARRGLPPTPPNGGDTDRADSNA